ncbi:carboxypeptidase regulatory-like domain-containing protein [Sphingomonas sp. LM7]|uniref:carboxypeptidase regulatory-like domain-containing protein n=1 Tax=Sphingomonas sp. LM7 TaxID=1938607 RepID=UPI000983A386|nr:carboxypeptidase regulatory-like domain-containing protein [Sphingomonas sp. LM7]AQR72875.1 hypothetical protein BXU08_03565 [Sphingomonas sp. LM7]
MALAIATLSIPTAGAQTIRNTAAMTFATAEAGPQTIASNTVTLDLAKRPTQMRFHEIPAGYEYTGLACQTDPVLQFTPSQVSPRELAKAPPLATIQRGQALIIELDAQAENRDPLKREVAWIDVSAGDLSVKLPITETSENTGVFAGGVSASGTHPEFAACDIAKRASGSKIRVSFVGSEDSFSSEADVLVDPEGYVFDSLTGALIDGATVTLIDNATGRPAERVYGDDGTSAYPNTVISGGSATDASGQVYNFSPGNFRFPLAPKGFYRLQVTPPGAYTAPSRVTPDALAHLTGPPGAFRITDASYGGKFELFDPEPVHIDIPIDPIIARTLLAPQLVLEKTASVREASPGEFVQYRLDLRYVGLSPTVSEVVIDDTLPTGLRYRPGTTRGAPEPTVSADGRKLSFTLPRMMGEGSAAISYILSVAPGARQGDAVNRAIAWTVAGRSNEASALVRIRPLLMTDAMTLLGRVTEGGCGDPLRHRKGVAGIRVVIEDGSFTVTDANGFYHFEGVRPGTHVVQLDTASLPVTHAPATCDRDTRSAGSDISRFVEGQGGSLQRADFQLVLTGKAAVADTALPVVQGDDALAAGNRTDWLDNATPGVDWLFPEMDHNPRSPALRVVIRHQPGQRIALSVNGKQVEALSFDGTDADAERDVAISRWTGIPLADRDNKLEARVLDKDGNLVTTLTRTVHYANVPLRAELVAGKSRLIADGLTKPLVAIRVTDRDGRPVRAGTIVPFRVDQPYGAAQETEAQQGRQLAGLDRTEATARVIGDDGVAFVALQPTTQAGSAHITIKLADQGLTQTSEIKAFLAAPARDWMVVGFARGTAGFDMLRSKSKTLPRRDRSDVTTDGQVALYAKGRIKGSWLLTLAYDSDRAYDPDRGLLGTIDPNRYYTVYGDASQQAYDAPTRGNLYLRLERKAFYALFGDFETGFVDTRLARYSRTLNGVKAEASGDTVTFSAFAARDEDRYGRDEIQGNGLSGPYRLSARDIVPNSDKITLETRDRLRSDRILDSKLLTRHIDYDIDAIGGTLRFREPILSRDADLNPVYIVADYETYGRGRKIAAGGRGAVKLAKGKVELGATVLHDQAQSDATVAGLDLRARPVEGIELRAEVATGGREGLHSAQALTAEVEHHGGGVDVLAYLRHQEAGFGVGQQNAGEAGTTKAGADARLQLGGGFSATLAGWRQEDLTSDASRTAGEARVEYRKDSSLIFAGAQLAADHGADGQARNSTLLTVGGTQSLLGNKLELTTQAQVAIGGADDSTDFPARQQIGLSWKVRNGVRLIGGYEIAKGDDYLAHNARIGFEVAPWTGARLMSTINQQALGQTDGENGRRAFAQYGLSQSLPLGKHWTVDATVDASTTVSGEVPETSLSRPVIGSSILGQNVREGDFVAITAGAGYRSELWSWNGRAEFRTSQESRRLGVTSNLLRTLGEGKTLASSLRAYRTTDSKGRSVVSATGDLALALRPADSPWSLLERFTLRHEQADQGVTSNNVLDVPTFAQGGLATLRAVNSLAIGYRSGEEGASHGFEASVYYGAKYVRGRYADEKLDGFIDVIGAEIRKDVRRNLDIGVQGSVQHSWTEGTASFSVGPSVGVSPSKGLWFSAGYNIAGYRDRDFEDERYTRQGPYVTLRAKFDQSLMDRARNLFGGRQ